eukprot:Transcript_6910.p2 GENE.Transcript_6910~~Transcript_6910.p2  ORF type:complete len:295 (-),score=84.89 Transcript_6910:85-969(-)
MSLTPRWVLPRCWMAAPSRRRRRATHACSSSTRRLTSTRAARSACLAPPRTRSGSRHSCSSTPTRSTESGAPLSRQVVTLDTHHAMHIAHGHFWKGADGKSPDPFTVIKAEDVASGKWTPRQAEMGEWALEYCQSLEEGGRFLHNIWPDHCLLGSAGHAVTPALLPALNKWSELRERSITWVLKGQNNRTEMYSALKAEVPVDDDPATKLNMDLITTLGHHSQVVVCGEAKSHCVNYTLRDLVSGWPDERIADLVLLQDGCSPVPGFEESADKFESDMRAKGVTIVTSTDYAPN